MTDHIEPLRVIRERLAEVAAPIGLELREMDVRVAAENGGPDIVVALFTIDMDQIGKTEEKVTIDAQIAEMEQALLQQTRDERADEARANLEQLFKKYQKEE